MTSRLSDLIRTFIAFFTAQLIGYVLMLSLAEIGAGFQYNILLNILCNLVPNGAAFLLICGKTKLPTKCNNFSFWELPAFLFGGVFLACAAVLLTRLLYSPEPVNELPQGIDIDIIFYCSYTLILAPVAEEITFRGAALSRLRNSFGGYSAAVISAILFAAYHMNLAQFPYTFILGLFLAIVAQRSGSLIPCLVLHSLNNLMTLAAALSDTIAAIIDIALPILGTAGILVIIITKRYKLNNTKTS